MLEVAWGEFCKALTYSFDAVTQIGRRLLNTTAAINDRLLDSQFMDAIQ
jgi:hypothetical protein